MAQALAATGDPAAAIILGIKLRFPEGKSGEVLQECMQALVSLGAEDAFDLISPYLEHRDSALVAYAALMIAQTGAPEAPGLLKSALRSLTGDLLRAVILGLSALRSEEARAILYGLADDPRLDARLALVEALHAALDDADRACLERLAKSDRHPQVRDAALNAVRG